MSFQTTMAPRLILLLLSVLPKNRQIMCLNTLYSIESFANLSCFRNSTEEGPPEKKRNNSDRLKIHDIHAIIVL